MSVRLSSCVFPYTTLFRSARQEGRPFRQLLLHRADQLRRPSLGLEGRAGLRDRRQRADLWLGVHGLSTRSEEHTSELQSLRHLVCRLLLAPNTPGMLSVAA